MTIAVFIKLSHVRIETRNEDAWKEEVGATAKIKLILINTLIS